MKRIIIVTAAFFLVSLTWGQNPILIGKAFNSDPQARVWTVGGKPTLFVYGSRDESPSYYCSGKYDVFSTTDMINWTGGPAFSSSEVRYNDEVLYAPDCIERNGKYYLFYSQPGANPEGTAVSDSPHGPFRDGKTVITLEAEVGREITGVHPLRMRFHGESDTNLFSLTSFHFEK